MPTTFASLGPDDFGRDEKITVVEDSCNDIAEPAALGSRLTDAQRAELKRRIAHMKAHPDEWIPLEEFVEGTLDQCRL